MLIYGVFEVYQDCDYHKDLLMLFKDKEKATKYKEQEENKIDSDIDDTKIIVEVLKVFC